MSKKTAAEMWAEMKAAEEKKKQLASKAPARPTIAPTTPSKPAASPSEATSASTAESDAPASFAHSIQRDINFLSDSDRFMRKKGLDNLRARLLAGSRAQIEAQVSSIFSELLKPLLKLFSDPVEKCREESVKLLTQLLDYVPNLPSTLPYIMPVVTSRVGSGPTVVESSEETRLALVLLVTKLVHLGGEEGVSSLLDDLCAFLVKSFADNYAEVKKEACACVTEIARVAPKRLAQISPTLAKNIRHNFTHQHSKVRVYVVKAIGVLVGHGALEELEELMQTLKGLTMDHAPAVREAVIEISGVWLLNHIDRFTMQPTVLPLLLAGLCDEMPQCRELALSFMDRLGVQYEEEHAEDLKDTKMYSAEEVLDSDERYHRPLPVPFTGRPRLGSRLLVRTHVHKLVPALLRDLSDWNPKVRALSAGVLQRIIVFSEEYVTAQLEQMLATFFRASKDDEAYVAKEVLVAIELTGRFVRPDAYLPLVLSHLTGFTNSAPVFRTSVLEVLGHLARGTGSKNLQPHMQSVVDALGNPELCASEHTELKLQLVDVLKSLLSDLALAESESSDALVFGMYSAVVRLIASSSSQPDIQKKASAIIDDLARALSLPSAVDVHTLHFLPMLRTVITNYRSWTKLSPELPVFDTLVRLAGPAVSAHLDLLLPLFYDSCGTDGDHGVRMLLMTLFNTVLQHEPVQRALAPTSNELFLRLFIPNLVWRSGRTAAAIRKSTIACVSVALRQNVLQPPSEFIAIVPELQGTLNSCMDDDDPQTRFVSCKCQENVLAYVGKEFPEEPFASLYWELLKRMDDSNDEIRIQTTKNWTALLVCCRTSLDTTKAEEAIKNLLIHLDDTNPSVQSAVLECLQEFARRHPAIVQEECRRVRDRHRSPRWCDELLKACDESLASMQQS